MPRKPPALDPAAGRAAVNAHVAAQPPAGRRAVTALRRALVAAAPGATEAIRYGIPALIDGPTGKALVGFAAFKDHVSLFPMSHAVFAEHAAALAPYRAGAGTVRFELDGKLPVRLVQRVVRSRLKAVRAAART